MDEPVRKSAERFIDRELSWLAFNRRVLEEAQDVSKPLIERAKFLAIVSSNLDEFTMVRYAELCMTPSADTAPLLGAVRSSMRSLVDDQYRCWRDMIEPALRAERLAPLPASQWNADDRETLRRLYHDQIEPVLTPLAVDPARPFPMVANRGLCVAVQLRSDKSGTRNALVSVPSGNRLMALVSAPGGFALLEDVVQTFVDSLFPGYAVLHRCLFRVTRDGALDIDEDQTTDLLSEIEQELHSREHGQPVRLELAADADESLRTWLLAAMALKAEDAYIVNGPIDLTFLFGLSERAARPELCEKPLQAVIYPPAEEWEDPFGRIRAGEILLHHPYQSFHPVVELVERAAADPRVLAIKQTLYRVSGDSPMVKALIEAARSGKQVTVLIELKARFDEAVNIKWARRLEEAGAHVIYGLVGYKVHAKLLMIIRRDNDGICRYVHLGTGNYNDKTARLYTDLSYLTSNEAVGRDVAALFNMLTGYSQPPQWERLAVAPLNLRRTFTHWIRREAEHARGGRGGRIIAKFNSLVDVEICDELYAASKAGVQIDLIVRGMCILRPGVPEMSENIRVRSLVGRFLEHNRIYYFANGTEGGAPGALSEPLLHHDDGEPALGSSAARPAVKPGRPLLPQTAVLAIASADWMTRNLDRRVECLARIESPALQERLLRLLAICLNDTMQARILRSDGTYQRVTTSGKRGASLVDELAAESEAASTQAAKSAEKIRFKPQRRGK
jgi:polyphosphate kinase